MADTAGRIDEASGKVRLNLTYDANCMPYSILARPKTNCCNKPITCPWCFLRRRVDVTISRLKEVPLELRNSSKLLSWSRELPFEDTAELPFFESRQGPHAWTKALVTTQGHYSVR